MALTDGPRPPGRGLFALAVALVSFYAAAVPVAARREGDFVHLWAAGRLVVEGRLDALYDPATQRAALLAAGLDLEHLWMARNDVLGILFYPPPTALAYAALGALPLRTAAGVQAVLGLIFAVLSARLARELGRPPIGVVAALAMILGYPSFFYSYVLGQNGVYSLCAIALGLVLLLRDRPMAGGAALGLLALKPSWLLAVAWLPLIRGGRRAWLGMALSGAALALGSALILGLEPWRDFLAALPGIAALDRAPGYPVANQYNLLSLSRRALGVGPLADALGWGGALALVGLTLARARALAPDRALGAGVVAASLCNPHLHHYDLLPPLLGLAVALGRGGRAPLALLVASHAAPVLTDVLRLAPILPLPTLAALALWAWLCFGRETVSTLTVS